MKDNHCTGTFRLSNKKQEVRTGLLQEQPINRNGNGGTDCRVDRGHYSLHVRVEISWKLGIQTQVRLGEEDDCFFFKINCYCFNFRQILKVFYLQKKRIRSKGAYIFRSTCNVIRAILQVLKKYLLPSLLRLNIIYSRAGPNKKLT